MPAKCDHPIFANKGLAKVAVNELKIKLGDSYRFAIYKCANCQEWTYLKERIKVLGV